MPQAAILLGAYLNSVVIIGTTTLLDVVGNVALAVALSEVSPVLGDGHYVEDAA